MRVAAADRGSLGSMAADKRVTEYAHESGISKGMLSQQGRIAQSLVLCAAGIVQACAGSEGAGGLGGSSSTHGASSSTSSTASTSANSNSSSGMNFQTGSGGAPPAVDVDVVITADNAYSFGYGDQSGIAHFTQGTRAQFAGQIFNCGEGPEAYKVPAAEAPPTAFLYIITWDDLAVTQGVLGQFRRGNGTPLYTGHSEFEVCATGIDMRDSQTGPAQAEINAQIALCNTGAGDPNSTSKGWVNAAGAVTPGAIGSLAIGEANSTGDGNFPPVCVTGGAPPGVATIDPNAAWMWYQPGGVGNPFQSTGSNTFRAYLIFRIGVKDIAPPS